MSTHDGTPTERLAIHATHEAAGKIAGIGAVLDGILPQESYRKAFPVSVLVGPYTFPGGRHPLPETLFDSQVAGAGAPTGLPEAAAAALSALAAELGTRIVVGRRSVGPRGADVKVDVLLVSPSGLRRSKADSFRHAVRDRYGFDLTWYENAYPASDPRADTSLDRILQYLDRVRREGPGAPEPPFLGPDAPLRDHHGGTFFGGVPWVYDDSEGVREDRAHFPPIESLDGFSGIPKTNPYLLELEFYFLAGYPLWRAAAALTASWYLPAQATLFAHDWLAVPVFLAMKVDEPGGRPRVPWPVAAVYFAHEARIARMLVEGTIKDKAPYLATRCHPDGHDVSFYAHLARLRAHEPPLGLDAAFPELRGSWGWKMFDDIFYHALNRQAARFDRVVAVGENVRKETEMILAGEPNPPRVALCPNGIPDFTATGSPEKDSLEARQRRQAEARERLVEFARAQVGFEPDVIFTAVNRCELSKGPWRNVEFFRSFVDSTAGAGTKALFIWLSRPRPLPTQDQVERWSTWGWPKEHRPMAEGGDLRPEEVLLWDLIRSLNRAGEGRYRILYVNQFGWDRGKLGALDPVRSTFPDLRLGTDAEIGLSVYEPFGIAPLEPFSSGAVCLLSDASGCALHLSELRSKGLVGGDGFVVGRFTRPDIDPARVGLAKLREIEATVYGEMTQELIEKMRTPRSERLASAQAALPHLSWTKATEYLLGALG